MSQGKTPYGVLFVGIALVAFATLLFEVSLIRVLSFTIWYHFGYVVISAALLGFAASGTFLAVAPGLGTGDVRRALARASLLSAVTAVGALGFFCLAPLDPMRILAEPSQAALFLGYQIGAAVPFFFSGLVVSLAMREAATRVDRLYFWDLVGAGAGCASAVALMNRFTPPGAAVAATAAFAAAAVIFSSRAAERLVAAGLSFALLAATGAAGRMPFRPADSKELSILVAFGAVPRFMHWSGLFRTDVVEQVRPRAVTARCSEWGASALAPADCHGPRLFISHDGTAGAPMFALRDHEDLSYLDYDVLRVPYLVTNPHPRVLVIGVGGGRDVVVAQRFGASDIVGVELDPVTVDIVRDVMNDVSDGFFRRPGVRLVAGDGRHFARTTSERFDLIQITAVDTLSALFSGAYVLAENYLYTVEAFDDYLDHLRPGGILSITTGDLDPSSPQAAGRMVSVARDALRARGFTDPERHIAVIDSGNMFVGMLVRAEPFEPAQVQRLADHASQLRFVPLWLPNGQGHPVFRGLITAPESERRQLVDRLRFHVTATTDNDPFFFSFYRWTGLLHPGKVTHSHVSALGQIVLVALLVTLSFLGAILVLGPLAVFRRHHLVHTGREAIGILVYFLAVGIGFMLFEISFIQRFVLFLGYPTYSLSITLFALLTSLGCGSFFSRRWVGREQTVLPLAVGLIAGLTFFYIGALPGIQSAFLGASLLVRAAVATALIAPLGLVLGMFLPLGIRRAAALHPDLVPWAWGVNGCASVTGGVLAVVLAISFGFRTVWMVSLAVYALGAAVLLWSRRGAAPYEEPANSLNRAPLS